MSDARESEVVGPRRPGAAGIVVIVVMVLLLLVVLAMVLADREDGEEGATPSPSPVDPTPTAPFETPATPDPGLDELDDTDREPTDEDAAEFSSAYSPPGGIEAHDHRRCLRGRPQRGARGLDRGRARAPRCGGVDGADLRGRVH